MWPATPRSQCQRLPKTARARANDIPTTHRSLLRHANQRGSVPARRRTKLRSLPVDRVVQDVETPYGPARAHLHVVEAPSAAVVLGHGAGGGVESPDLVGATNAARSAGLTVALMEQPYRVARRRSPAPANQLDAAW